MSTSTLQSQKPKLSVLLILSSIPLLMVLGNSMLIPVLPTISDVLHVSKFQVSLLITLFSIPAAIVIPIAGILADRVGRKKVIFFSLLLYGFGGLLAGIASIWGGGSYSFLLASRIIQGIGAAGTAPIAMVLASDLYLSKSRSKVLGILESSNAMGKVISPIFGSLIALISWYTMFFVFPLFCIPVAILLWILIQEPASKSKLQPSQYKSHIKKTFQRQGKWLSVSFLAGAISLFTTFGVLFYLSDFLEKTHKIAGVKKGFVLAIPLLAMTVSAYFTGSFIKEQINQMKKLILLGLLLLMGAIAIVPWIKNANLLIIVTSLMGIGSGLILPCLNTLVTSAVGIQERGIITSLYGSVRFFGVALGPPVFGALSQHPFLLFLGTAALVGITEILAIIFIHRPQRLRGKEDRSRLLIRKRRFHPA